MVMTIERNFRVVWVEELGNQFEAMVGHLCQVVAPFGAR